MAESSVGIKFKLDDEQVNKIAERLEKLGEVGDKAVNATLTQASEIMKKYMIEELPVHDNSSRHKNMSRHAKDSDPFMSIIGNLEFTIKNKPDFHYLVFPDKGIGKYNKKAQNFIKKGSDNAIDEVTAYILDFLEKELKI